MGNVFHQKKTFVYLLKKGVLCQNLGPQQYWTMYVFNCCDQSFSWLNMTIVQDVLQAFVRLRTLRVWRSSAASSCRMLGNQALEVLLMAQESDLLTACLPNTANIQAWNVFFSGFAVVFKSWDSRISLWIITSSYIEISIKPWLSLTINWG
jgi:hypothetical protein